MGFTFNGVTSKSMKIRARLTSWQASPALRNFYETVPGKAGVADFGCDSAERTVKVECSVFPQKNFPALVAVLDGMAEWLDPTKGQGQLILDDVPDRYFMARLSEAVDCERLLRSAGQFTLSFICPDPYAYALTDETYIFSEAGTHMAVRHTGNTDSYPVYALKGVIPSGTSSYISIVTGGSELRVTGPLPAGETLLVDSALVTAKVVDSSGNTLRNGLPLLADRKSTRLNSSHIATSRMPSSA